MSSSAIDVPSKSALFVTVRSAEPSSLIAPAESRIRLPARLELAKSVPESSVISTAPVVANASVMKFVVSPPLSPSVIAPVPALNEPCPPIARVAPTASVISPEATTVRRLAVVTFAN